MTVEFKSITIRNFRNYKSVELKLENKNIIFGRNDFGKTNFLYALRFLFDPSVRNKGFEESDYYEKNTSEAIEITLELDISDEESNSENDLIRAYAKGATEFSEGSFYIQLQGQYDQAKQVGNPVLKWGGARNELKEVHQKGMYSELDNIFEVTYLDPNVSPTALFKKHKGLLYKEIKTNDSGERKEDKIKEAIRNLNEVISEDSRVQKLNDSLTDKYNDIREEAIDIEMRSEHEVNGVFNHLIPYIKDTSRESNENIHLYPTSGDGRQKILAYALTNLIEELKIEERKAQKISIFLIEEIENSLHPSMQQVVSRHLFQSNKELYPYVFITTHSEHVFAYMDEVNLIRIYRNQNLSITNESVFFQVPKKFKSTRKILNESLAYAFFYDKVLLVEGMSEKILFEGVLEKLAQDEIVKWSDLENILILSVEGIGFDHYVKYLSELGVRVMIKTDNDIKKVDGKEEVSLLGINRCRKLNNLLLGIKKKPTLETKCSKGFDLKKRFCRSKLKSRIYKYFEEEVNEWKEQDIYLSKIELEEDLVDALSKNTIELTEEKSENLVTFLQKAKKKNMNTFVNEHLNVEDAQSIYEHEHFKCLKALVGKGEGEDE